MLGDWALKAGQQTGKGQAGQKQTLERLECFRAKAGNESLYRALIGR